MVAQVVRGSPWVMLIGPAFSGQLQLTIYAVGGSSVRSKRTARHQESVATSSLADQPTLDRPRDQHPRIRSHLTTLGSGNQDNSVGLDFPESTIIKDNRVPRVTAPY